MYRTMADALNAANTNPGIRATALLGTEGCFSAGNDMNDFLAAAMGGRLLDDDVIGHWVSSEVMGSPQASRIRAAARLAA
ncbi:hypothetical protein AB9F40_34440, partial [Rhizobium leguminosarum]